MGSLLCFVPSLLVLIAFRFRPTSMRHFDTLSEKLPLGKKSRPQRRMGHEKSQNYPKEKNLVRCKWIFTVKYKVDGSVDKYKPRLVAKGFTQSYGIDYQETFAPVAKLNTIWVLLSLVVNLDWTLHQLDVKNALLNSDLEEVYMEIPSGLETKANMNKVCKLKKSLYGLKQSPHVWFERFTKVFKRYRYSQCQTDQTLTTLTKREDSYYHCLCWWYYSERRSWGRNRKTQRAPGKRVWNQRSRKSQVFPWDGGR